MQYELVRSNRRTLAITIDGSGQVRGARANADAYGGDKKIYRRKAQLD